MSQEILIGKLAVLLATLDDKEVLHFQSQLKDVEFCTGKVGAMNMEKVIAAVETAAKRENIIAEHLYRENHALYHTILEALEGITRGQFAIGDMKRTVGLRFAIIKGKPYTNKNEGEWIAVAFYGTIGAPVKGLEHEVVGLGINHV
ncbi:hut operon transcriptional regulator HutP [Lysinibacillus fusiformis]|nr:hut operon transcriptional regulator HutP [Lysinibacillus fusiformis]